MTIQDLGSIGEVVAAIATVVTLAYLALQIRENTRAIRVDALRSYSSAAEGAVVAIASSDSLADIFNRGLSNYDSLNPTELTRFRFITSQLVTSVAQTYLEAELGHLDSCVLDAQKSSLQFLKSPCGRKWWTLHKASLAPKFQAWVDEIFGFDA